MPNVETEYPKYAALVKPDSTEAFEVTMNKQKMAFYHGAGCSVIPLVEASLALKAHNAFQSMRSVYLQCFARGLSAVPGDKVMFDNAMHPLTPAEEHILQNIGMLLGGIYTVVSVRAAIGSSERELMLDSAHPNRGFKASKFLILPKA